MKKLVLLLLILFMSVTAVSASQNASDVAQDGSNVILDDVNHTGIDDVYSSDDVNALTDGENDSSDEFNDTKSVSNDKIVLKGKDLVAYYKSKPVYKVSLKNSTGKAMAGLKVKIIFKGKTYVRKTDNKGLASFNVPAKAGKYSIAAKYGNVSIKNKILLFKSRTTSRNVHSVYGKAVNYKLKVLDNKRKIMKGAKVTFKVGKKVYHKKTNSRGVAVLRLNYDSGNYVIYYCVDKIHGNNKYVVSNRISLKIFDWGIRGNHIAIPIIRKNMPNNPWVKKVVAATKKGLPLITFQGGKGKKVFITAGVHGNEIPAQVAVMKLIQYLSKKPIKGTVYIIPFVNIKAAYYQVRLTDYDFNRVADVPGTVSNKIVNLIVKLKCDCYGDFHSTESPGDPGLNIILGFYSPKKSVEMTNYLAKSCNVHKRFHYAGGIHMWTLADWATYKGIPSVLCEVISKVSTVSKFNSALSYKMMNRFLKFNSII